MKLTHFLVLFSLFVHGSGLTQDTAYLTSYAVGETNVAVYSRKFPPSTRDVTFINLHDNEKTSVKAALYYLETCGGGKLVQLPNEEERFINVTLSGKSYRFDPNRIYSREGRKSTIKKLSDRVNDTVQSEVAYLANQLILNHVKGSNLIVAIHNNTDSLLSILSYLQDQNDKRHFGEVFVNPEMDPDDFILTTDRTIFKKIKERNINVVWENSALIKDDGSLSVYAGLNQIPYINIEAEHEHLEEQVAMLHAVDDIIKEYGEAKQLPKITGANKPVFSKSRGKTSESSSR